MGHSNYKSRRMETKYRMRRLLVVLVGLVLAVVILFGISAGIKALRVQLNTTTLGKITAADILSKEGLSKVLETMKQDDSANVLVVDSKLTMSGGIVTGLEMNLTSLTGEKSAESWLLTASPKKARLRKTATRYESLHAQRLRLVELKSYYPALSRVTSPQFLQLLNDSVPVGEKGIYTFQDQFGNNLEPEYDSSLRKGLTGVWVSKIGGTSSFVEGSNRPNICAPTILSVQAVNPTKSKGGRIVLNPHEDKMVVLFEAGPYS